VTETYAVDETIYLDPSSTTRHTGIISPAMRRTLEIGALCNNALMERNEEGLFIGQSTDVALLNVLQLVGVPDRRAVSFFFFKKKKNPLSRTKHSNCAL
jgi:Ca2+-transporting ATPase